MTLISLDMFLNRCLLGKKRRFLLKTSVNGRRIHHALQGGTSIVRP